MLVAAGSLQVRARGAAMPSGIFRINPGSCIPLVSLSRNAHSKRRSIRFRILQWRDHEAYTVTLLLLVLHFPYEQTGLNHPLRLPVRSRLADRPAVEEKKSSKEARRGPRWCIHTSADYRTAPASTQAGLCPLRGSLARLRFGSVSDYSAGRSSQADEAFARWTKIPNGFKRCCLGRQAIGVLLLSRKLPVRERGGKLYAPRRCSDGWLPASPGALLRLGRIEIF
jgi:hypothetical protein